MPIHAVFRPLLITAPIPILDNNAAPATPNRIPSAWPCADVGKRYVDGLCGSPTIERVVADRRYACGNGYAGKAGTIREREVTDRRYACADVYAGKAGATGERVVADRRYAFGDGYTAAYCYWNKYK